MYEFKEEKTILTVSAIQTVGDIQVWRVDGCYEGRNIQIILVSLFMNLDKNPNNKLCSINLW